MAWTWWVQPRAITHGGKTWASLSRTNDDIVVVEYPGGDEVVLHRLSGVDDHCNAALQRLADGRLMAVWSEHGGDVFYRISTNPDDASAWGTRVNITSTLGGSGVFTYPRLFTVDGTLRMYLRSASGSTVLSTWSGSAWSAASVVVTSRFVKFTQTGSRLDAVFSQSPSASPTAKMYHGYLVGSQWHQSDGTEITPTTYTDFTEVDSVDRPRALDIAPGPIILYQHYTTYPSASDYRYAVWNGSSWDVETIVAADGQLATTHNVGGACLDEDDPETVYLTRKLDGVWQLFRYRTADAGSSWDVSQITDSAAQQLRPYVPRDAVSDLPVLWLDGSYTGEDSYDMDFARLTRGTPSSLAGAQSAWPSLRP